MASELTESDLAELALSAAQVMFPGQPQRHPGARLIIKTLMDHAREPLLATIREQRAEITRLESQLYLLTEDAGRQGD